MGELLQHLIETEKLDDPILARQASISVDLLEYEAKGHLAGQEPDQESRQREEVPREAARRLQQKTP